VKAEVLETVRWRELRSLPAQSGGDAHRTAEVDMLQGFKQFMLRGNVLDLAVAVVMGAAFGAVVTALVKDLITPLIAAIVGKPDFSAIQFTVHGSRFAIGDFINAIVSFILIGAAVYFFVVLPVNKLIARMRRGETPPDPTTKKCPECLSDVPIAARRCAFCTSSFTQDVSANAPPPGTRSRNR
jgi:large conductance mechanosensitive channel